LTTLLLASLLLAGGPSLAQAWDPFRSQNSDVNRGNEHLQKGQSAEALEAYETASRKLPNEAGVQLNRGLALMATDKIDDAREAFRRATVGSAPKDVRAKAYHNLGVGFARQAEQAAGADQLDAAKGYLTEAVDAFKSSLRAEPRNRDTAFNLELAKRRLAEVERRQQEKKEQEEKEEQEKKEQEEKEEQEKNKEQDQQQDQQKQDQQQDQQKQDQQQDQQKQDQQQDQQKQDQQNQASDRPEPEKADEPQDTKPDDARPSQPEDAEPQPTEAQPERPLPEHMRKALDALSDGEENLEKHRARMRARQRPRRVEKDW
jgi:tetratricopeptide (TPR) repeat protein